MLTHTPHSISHVTSPPVSVGMQVKEGFHTVDHVRFVPKQLHKPESDALLRSYLLP